MTDCVLALSQTKYFEWLAVMVISQPPGNNPLYYYRASPTLPQLLWMLPETPYVPIRNYNIRVTHRTKYTYYTNRSTEGSSVDCSLSILSLHALALHLAVKILLSQIFSMKICCFVFTHLSVVFPSRMPAGPHFVTQPILLSENILKTDINHQQKHKDSQTRLEW